MERLLKVEEIAALLAIPRASVYRLVRQGRIPAVRVGKHLRWRPKDLEAWLDRQLQAKEDSGHGV